MATFDSWTCYDFCCAEHAHAGMRLCCSQTTEDRFSRVKAQLTYESIGTNSVDQNQNAPTLYINSLIWVHTACKKLLFISANKDKSILRSMAQCVTRDRLHVLTRLIVCEYVYLPVDLAV